MTGTTTSNPTDPSPTDPRFPMGITHHLTDVTLQQYAAGALSAPMETLVACHLTACAACRRELGVHEALGGAVLGAGERARPRASASETLARAAAAGTGTARGERVRGGTDATVSGTPASGVPRPLGRLLPRPLETLDWHETAPGVRQFNLSSGPRTEGAFKLLHCAPGVSLSAHTHRERELTFVLRGGYSDEVGHFVAGDISDLDDTVEHRPVADRDGPCIALIATDSPVRYTELLGRLMQPFVGI